MTNKELIDNGWSPQICKIGTLYFKGSFFCRLDKDEVVFFSVRDDMNPLGRAKTFEEITNLEKNYYKSVIETLEAKLILAKADYKDKYGEEI